MKMKQLLSVILALCMVLSMLPVATLAADIVTVTAQVPASWTKAYCYGWVNGVGNPNWPGVAMTKSGNVWTAQIPADCDRVIITAGSSGPQTLDLMMTPGVDAYVVLGSMSGGKYTATVQQYGEGPIDPVVPSSYYVTGRTSVFGNWAECNEAGKMTEQDGLYVKVFEGVPEGYYEIKVNDGTWNNSWGVGINNYTFDVARDDSTVTVTFDPVTTNVDVEVVSPEVEEPVEAPELVDGYYEITNADQLYWFAAQVNSGSTTINGKLMADIVVNENVLNADGTLNGDGSNFRVWTPIGYYDSWTGNKAEFAGTFDGNGKTISGLYYNDDTTWKYVGLFGRVDADGVVKNLGIVESYMRAYVHIGGIASHNKGTVTNCYNTGVISGKQYVAGVVYNNSGTVSNCYNTGNVSCSVEEVGGVVGSNWDGTVLNCYNTGNVDGGTTCYTVGGVVGSNYDGTTNNCYNTGSISGKEKVGGVAGTHTGGSLSNCFNAGAVRGNVSVGAVTGYSSNYNTKLQNNYYLSGCAVDGNNVTQNGVGCDTQGSTAADQVGVTTCVTAAQFASGEVAYLLQGDQEEQVWGQKIGTDEYPVLGGDKVYLAEGEYSNTSKVPTLNNGYYEIYNADQLYWFAEQVNGGETSINGKLMENIVVNENVLNADGTLNGDGSNFRVWTPIGEDYSCAYNGTFEGNGKTVSGLYSNKLYDAYVGLFGEVYTEGVVRNVGVVDSYFWGEQYVGGVVGFNYYGTVTNCYNTGTVSGDYSVGGVVGSGNVTNCYNAGVVTGKSDVGGVIGYVYDTADNCYNCGTVNGTDNVGGVVGSGNPSNCYNTGVVTGEEDVGGVVGRDHDETVIGCYNSGTVSGTNYVGGVVGNSYSGTIENCYNTGTVSGSKEVGGVAGREYYGTVSNCYNTGAVTGVECVGGVVGKNYATMVNCYNTGTVSGDTDVGGVEGYSSPSSIDRCYYLSGCVIDGNSFGTAMTAEQFASGEVAYLLQGDQEEQVWGQCIGTDDSPRLGDNRLYRICDGTKIIYTNDINAVSTHVLQDGTCWVCGEYKPAVLNGEVYEIYTAAQLYWFAQQVNSGSTAISGKLMENIVVNENVLNADGILNGDGSNFRVWTPIGYYESWTFHQQYSGTFDGNGKTVSGLYFNDENRSYAGLIGYMSGGTVKNVTVLDSYIKGNQYVGSVVGSGYFANVSDCSNGGTVIGKEYIGGVIGAGEKVNNCSNFGRVEGIDSVGGVVGDGYAIDCHNSGMVTGQNAVGGVLGDCSILGPYFYGCYNTGTINGITRVGGVVGFCFTPLRYCYNTGSVSGEEMVGGVVGYSDFETSNCYNTGSVTGQTYVGGVAGKSVYGGAADEGTTMDSCYNTGMVSGVSNVGGVTGASVYGGVYGCYYLSGCVSDSNKYGTVVTAEQLASGEVAYLLQGEQTEQIWGQKIGTENLPVFSEDKVYCVTDEDTVLGYSNVEGQLPVLGVTVSGQLTSYLEGDVTVELVQDGEVVYSTTATDGSYVFEGVVAGDYTLRISKANHIPQEYAITVGDEAVTQDAKICPKGDVTGDGVVNIKDFQRLLRHVNKTNPLTDYALLCGDVTGDGVCNIKDFQRLLRHVNKTNPLF